jgi:hypothetical protein
MNNRQNMLNPEETSLGPVACTLTLQEMLHIQSQNFEVDEPYETVIPSATESNTSVLPHELLPQICVKFKLNDRQHIAFIIAANSWLTLHAYHQTADPSHLEIPPQLRMFLTGPGGTGKTHVVGAVHPVMTAYGCGHCIRYLAPTGGAAKLINGMTVHKGLGIKIIDKSKGKGNRKPGDDKENYSVIINVN